MASRTIYFIFFLLVHFIHVTHQDSYPFQDPSLSFEERAANLVSLLTFDEVVEQLSRGGTVRNGPAPPIPRLGIGPYSWNTECVGGAAASGKATSFSQPIGMAASFSVDMVHQVAEATSVEVHAKFNDFTAHQQYGDHKGLSCFSPVVNIMRHPLWGRNQETFGEDPYLSGQIGAAFIRGIQGDDPRYLRTNGGCKHFAVHGGPDTIPVSRFSFNAEVSMRDWRVTFLPAFRECFRAGSLGAMCSFNRINGVPACADDFLLTEILRKEWGFKGYVIADEDAIEFVMTQHNYTKTIADTAAACLAAGTNLELVTDNPDNFYFVGLPQAVAQGNLTEQHLRDSVTPLFYTRLRLGEFDPPSMNPYTTLDLSVLQSDAHRNVSLLAAMKTFVLLKNANGILPLKKIYSLISVIGPMADNPAMLFGVYTADYDPAYTTTPMMGLQQLSSQTNFAAGCDDTECNTYDRDSVLTAVQGSELVFVCLGTGRAVEAEGKDRSSMTIPGQQNQILRDAIAASGGAPVILLLYNAGPVEIDETSLASVSAIIECFIPGQSAGEAIRRILFMDGEDSVPAGRLPYTWPKSMDQVPEMTNYTMVNRTYRYWYQDPPLYPFGYGLSYTSFQYSNLEIIPSEISAGQTVDIRATVRNIGEYTADEVIQVYISWLDTEEEMPLHQLVHFERVSINAGSGYELTFTLAAERMEVYTDESGFVVEPGRIAVYVGGQQPNQAISVNSEVLNGEFSVV